MRNLRPLNAPRPIHVTTDAAGRPVTVRVRAETRRVARILDEWRLHDEWWREELKRQYFHIEYDDGGVDTIYRDLVTGEWFWQRA